MRRSLPVLLALAAICLLGCDKLSSDSPGVDDELLAHYRAVPPIPPSDSPTLPWGGDASVADNCNEIPVEGCLWAKSHDAVVYGKVVGMQFDDEILYRDVPGPTGWEPVDPIYCDEIFPVFEVELLVERSTGMNPDSVITIRTGHRRYEFYSPYPYEDSQGAVAWHDNGNRNGGRMLQIGQMLGAGLHYHTDVDAWFFEGDAPFVPMVDSDGKEIIAFPEHQPTCEAPPLDWNGLTLDELFNAIDRCEGSEEAKKRHDDINSEERPNDYNSAICWINVPELVRCETDTDCQPGEGCNIHLFFCVGASEVDSETPSFVDPIP